MYINIYIFLQTQEIYERIQESFDRVLTEKKELENTIKVCMEMYKGDETIGRFLERFNSEFNIGIRTDEFGRVINDEAGTSKTGDDDKRDDDDGKGDDAESEEDSENVNKEGENWIEEGENVDEQVENQSTGKKNNNFL